MQPVVVSEMHNVLLSQNNVCPFPALSEGHMVFNKPLDFSSDLCVPHIFSMISFKHVFLLKEKEEAGVTYSTSAASSIAQVF